MPQPESKPKLSFSGDALLSQPPVGPGRRTSLNTLYFLTNCDDDLGLLLPWVVGFRACGMPRLESWRKLRFSVSARLKLALVVAAP